MNPFKLQLFSFYLLAISTFLISFDTYGQTRIPDKYYYYGEVRMFGYSATFLWDKLEIYVDFGKDYPSMQPAKLQELATRIKTFKNGVDILNYMSDEGWEYVDKQVQHEAVQMGKDKVFYLYVHYTFRKLKS